MAPLDKVVTWSDGHVHIERDRLTTCSRLDGERLGMRANGWHTVGVSTCSMHPCEGLRLADARSDSHPDTFQALFKDYSGPIPELSRPSIERYFAPHAAIIPLLEIPQQLAKRQQHDSGGTIKMNARPEVKRVLIEKRMRHWLSVARYHRLIHSNCKPSQARRNFIRLVERHPLWASEAGLSVLDAYK